MLVRLRVRVGVGDVVVQLVRRQRALEIPRTNVPAAKPPIPEPRLEAVPGFSKNPERQDVAALKERQRRELSTWAPSDDHGFARVPIERAMDLAVERQMFKTAPPAPGAQRGASQRNTPQTRPAAGSSAAPGGPTTRGIQKPGGPR